MDLCAGLARGGRGLMAPELLRVLLLLALYVAAVLAVGLMH